MQYESKSGLSGLKVKEIFERTFFASNYDLKPQLKKINVPALIIHGDDDPIPTWTAKEIKDSIANSILIVLKNCGHFPYIEQPKPFFHEINKFLEKIEI